jgi:predicted ABC-type exoprotein transport system permease subunit
VLKRPTLLWLLVPYLLFLAALPLVNRIHPTVLGVPFLFFWILLATLLTPAAVHLAWRGDKKRGRV